MRKWDEQRIIKKLNNEEHIEKLMKITNISVTFFLPIILIIFIVITIVSTRDYINSIPEPTEIKSKYEDLSIEEVVAREVKKQLAEIEPVTIEFVNASVVEGLLYYEEIPMDKEHQAILFQSLKEYHVGTGLALAIIESESDFDINASSVGSNGITYHGAWQISDVNARYLKQNFDLDISDPSENLIAGCIILSELIEKYGMEYGTEYIINAYKGGESAAAEWYGEGFTLPCVNHIVERAMYYDQLTGGAE